MTKQIRIRFAPSPTGSLHVGNIRTALFAWFFARHNSGSFILRIEDTDTSRKVEGAVEEMMDSLKWLGMDWDEGPDIGGKYEPYVQSERLDLYKFAAQQLISQGDAYYCYCSPKRLTEMREEQVKHKQSPGYDRHCRDLPIETWAEKAAEGIEPVIRLKAPLEGETRFTDIVWGEVKFENNVLDDLVLLKSDGFPTYNLANIVDDHVMEISHVIRAEEFISTTPHHLLLYKAMGYEPPQFAHLPMVLGSDRSKLGKRHGAVSVDEFQKQGYLPEAMINFLALLGWSLDDKTEIMTRQQLIENFSLERVGKTAAIFDHKKLDWMNGVYIRGLSVDDFTQRALPFLEKGLPKQVKRPLDKGYVRRMMPLVQERINTLAEAATYADFFFIEDLEYDTELLIGKKMTKELTVGALEASLQKLSKLVVLRESATVLLEGEQQKLDQLEPFNSEVLETLLRPLAEELGLKAGQLFGALRTAVTGRTATPPLFDTMAVLGKERCLKRIIAAIARLGNNQG
ncbi:glutamate--tRNA ligase [Chloroflexota bacterium]